MNDMEAALGREAIENFWITFYTRHAYMKQMRKACLGFEDVAWFSEEDNGYTNCPHGFSITCKKENDIEHVKSTLDKYNIHWKRNFGCIPTQHSAFSYLGHSLGDFPESEHVGDNGMHIGVHQHLSVEDVDYVCQNLIIGFQKI